jgi:ketosteroid isomerase-like protein
MEMIDSPVDKGNGQKAKMQRRRKARMKAPTGVGVSRSARQAAASLRAADAAWLKAYRAKKAAEAAAFYDERGAMLIPNAPLLTGRKRITRFIAKSFTMRDYKIWWRCDKAEAARSGELGYTSGVYRMSLRDASGKSFRDRGKYLMVWKKQQDGFWKVLFDMSNSDVPVRRD